LQRPIIHIDVMVIKVNQAFGGGAVIYAKYQIFGHVIYYYCMKHVTHVVDNMCISAVHII